MLRQEGVGEYAVEWMWDGEDLKLQRDEVSSSGEKDMSAKELKARWKGVRSYD